MEAAVALILTGSTLSVATVFPHLAEQAKISQSRAEGVTPPEHSDAEQNSPSRVPGESMIPQWRHVLGKAKDIVRDALA
jgi:hypothetical protein